MKKLLTFLFITVTLTGQTATFNPTALTDYSPLSTLYLGTYNTGLYDSTPFSSGAGTNTPPSGYNTDSLAAAARVVPLDQTGAPCSGPPYATNCRIGFVSMGMSIPGRDSCYGLSSGSLNSLCVAESFKCQSVGALAGDSPGGCSGTGNPLVTHATNAGGQPIMSFINCAIESQQLEQWQSNTQSNYTHCDTAVSNNGLTPQQVEVIMFMGVDTTPGGATQNHPALCCDMAHLLSTGATPDSRDISGTNCAYPATSGTAPNINTQPKSATQIDMCMYMVNLGLVSRFIKTYRYPNVQQIFWNHINYAGFNSVGGAQPEPFAYETGFGIRNSIQAQIKQRAGSYSSPAWNVQTLDVNYDCAGNPGTGGNGGGANCTGGNTTCTCSAAGGTHCATANLGQPWPCAPIWEWGNYEWAPACTAGGGVPGGTRLDGFCWNYSDFTHADNVHPISSGVGSQVGIMKVNTGMLVSGNLVGGTVPFYLNSSYASWFQASSPPPPAGTGGTMNGGGSQVNGNGGVIQ